MPLNSERMTTARGELGEKYMQLLWRKNKIKRKRRRGTRMRIMLKDEHCEEYKGEDKDEIDEHEIDDSDKEKNNEVRNDNTICNIDQEEERTRRIKKKQKENDEISKKK